MAFCKSLHFKYNKSITYLIDIIYSFTENRKLKTAFTARRTPPGCP